MSSRGRAALRALGPWPIRDKEIAFLLSLFVLLSGSVVEMNVGDEATRLTAFQAIQKMTMPAVITAAVVFLPLRLGRTLMAKFTKVQAPIYFATAILLGALIVPMRWLLIDIFNIRLNSDLVDGLPLFWVTGLMYLSINASMGRSTAKLAAEVDRTQTLLHELEGQRTKIIEAQEQVRKEIATYLHDGLQSQLVVLGLQMRNSIKNLPADQAAIANSFIEEIEHIRRVDVRKASQQLSPDLQQISVATAIRDIADRYSPEVKVAIGIDSAVQSPALPERTKLALYRIAEQVILNAAAHGQARNVWLSIAAQDGHFDFQIANDGHALSNPQNPGGGAAIISSWVDYLDGSWSLTQEPGQHVLFKATLNLPVLDSRG
jgi:signal transduction histidine kinase